MNKYVFDEIKNISQTIRPKTYSIDSQQEYVVTVGDDELSKYFACATVLLAKNVKTIKTHIIFTGEKAKKDVKSFILMVKPEDLKDTKAKKDFYDRVTVDRDIYDFISKNRTLTQKNKYIYMFLDSQANIDKDEYIKSLRQMAIYANSQDDNVRILHSTQIPKLKKLPSTMTAIAEREYEVYASSFDDNSAEKFTVEVENQLRLFAKAGLDVVATRVNNIFGPKINDDLFDKYIDDLKSLKTVNADTSNYNQNYGLTYIMYAAEQNYFAMMYGKSENIYNIQQFATNNYKLSLAVFDSFADYKIRLCCINSKTQKESNCLLSSKKIEAINPADYQKMSLEDCVYRSILCMLNFKFIDKSVEKLYDGKLKQIKSLKMEMLKSIDSCCKQNNIKYFLTSLSLLGAIRNEGFLEWDENLTIGMLRDDYKKLKKSFKNSQYVFSSHLYKMSYASDQIMLKDTIVEENIADDYCGIAINILIYDKTATEKEHQDKHIAELFHISHIDSKKSPALSILHSIDYYEKRMLSALKQYNNSSSQYLIGGEEIETNDKALPLFWFADTTTAKFESVDLPIPKGYDDYLKYLYGYDYLSDTNISARTAKHNIKRVDMAKYAITFGFEKGTYHTVNPKGELLDE